MKLNMHLKLMAAFLIVVLAAVASVVVFVRMDAANQVRTFMYRGGMSGSDQLVNELEEYYALSGSWDGVDSLVQGGAGMMRGSGGGHTMGMGMNSRELQLAGADGVIAASRGSRRVGEVLSAAEIDRSIPLEDSGGRTAGYLLVDSGSSLQQADIRPLIQNLNSAALRAGLVAGGVGVLLALAFAAGLIRPIRRLTDAANRLAAGELDQKVPAGGGDELAELARSFNSMSDSLKHAEEERRSMTADIAHELRTPLSVQRATLEAMQDGIYPADSEHLQVALDQNGQLSRLVEDLRTLALSDAGELGLQMEPVDPVEACRQAVSRFESQAVARGIQLTLNLPVEESGCTAVTADAGRIGQILNNLIENAIRHTPEGGRITLSAVCSGDKVELRVCDSGEGIPPETLPLIFDRFYRVDRGRTRAEGGSGLGLAIARQLARAQGGDLTAGNLPEGGAEFVLTLPAAAVDKLE